MASSSSLEKQDLQTAQVLKDLIQESLNVLLIGTGLVTWVWAVFVFLSVKLNFAHAFAVLALTLSTVWASYRLSKKHLRLAVGLYLGGLVISVTIIAFTFQSTALFYLYMLVVLITAMLTNPPVTWGVALGSILLVLVISRDGRVTQWVDVAVPITFILLTALTSWLGSWRLFTALSWALTMTRESQKNADEAQRHRGQVQRVLKSLDEAYARLERVNEALFLAQESARKAYRFKSEFVANVSHELRTPLNLIVGFSEMMATAPESYGGVPLPKEYRGDVTATYRSARHLSDLIDDVLDLSRIEAGRMPLIKEATDLGEVVREAAEMVRGLAEARGLRLEVEVPDDLPMLYLDRTRIRQVLLNLLTNATRYTDEGSIDVEIGLADHEAKVMVQDSGRGISPGRIARAFEAFSQLDDGQAREGSGLGLAVSKRFVEMHGGGMWIESEPGHGTTVGFSLPIPRDGRTGQVSPLTARRAPRGREGQPLVLLLHDDLRTLSLLHRYVEGYQFRLAETVGQVREIVHEAFPVAVVMDTIWASRWAERIKLLNLPPQTPLVTCPLPSMHRLGSLLGAADYLPKPITREELEAALSRLPEAPRTVLVVDDNPHVVRLLGRMLRAIDPSLQVLEAFGGQEGLEVMRTEQPDVVLLDLVMPEVDGYALLEEMKNDEALARTRIIIVSVRGIEEETAPIRGEIRVGREEGLSLTEILQILRATLSAVTQPAATVPSNAAALAVARPG
jgi:signal transduction histidine kinase/CheY-like chemotaxis protein